MRKKKQRGCVFDQLERRELLSAVAASAVDPLFLKADLAIRRPSTAQVLVSSKRDGVANLVWGFAVPTDTVIAGDINGDGLADMVAFRAGVWFIDYNRDGIPEQAVNLGQAGDTPLIGDVNGDGLGDLMVFRNGVWIADLNLGNNTFAGALTALPNFGQAGDLPVAGELNGDGRLDRAVYRPGTSQWLMDYGFKGTVARTVFFGLSIDKPFLADMNNDGIADLGLFRSGQFYIDTTRTGVVTNQYALGGAGDVVLAGNFDPSQVVHALKPAFAVWRPSNIQLYSDNAWDGSTLVNHPFGLVNGIDQPVTADFDGNTLTDSAIFRNGNWYIDTTFTGAVAQSVAFGQAGDKGLAADVNNDGFADLIVFRNGMWIVSNSSAGTLTGATSSTSSFGQAGDIPLAADFNGDNVMDRAVYRPSTGQWLIDYGWTGTTAATLTFGGQAGDVPAAFDFNSDRKADLVIYRNGVWMVDETLTSNAVSFSKQFGLIGDIPVPGFYDAGNSYFVKPGGVGNGTRNSPLGSVAAAVAAAPDGAFIRIAPGTYTDFPNFASRNNLTFAAANRFATKLAAPVGNAFQMASSTNIYLFNLTFASTDVSAQHGRGLVIVQSTAFGFGIRTNGNAQEGVYIAGSTTGARAYFRDSSFDSTLAGSGIFVEENATLVVENSTASYNGTGAHGATVQYGRGIIINSTGNITTLIGVTMDHNTDHGLVVDGTADILMAACSASFNANVNGAIFAKSVLFNIDGSVFNYNGTAVPRGPDGYNGLELELDAAGGGMILNSSFNNNTACGLFVGSGPTIVVENNVFMDNFCGIYVQGVNRASATIIGNRFNNSTPTVETSNGVGISGEGPATATIGSAAEPNLFNNFTGGHAIYFANIDGNGLYPSFTIPSGANVFINSPNPVSGTPVGGGEGITYLAPVTGDAKSFFDESYYLNHNADVAAAVLSRALASGWAHFQAYGQYESAFPPALYRESFYLNRYPDVAAAVSNHAFTSGFVHFVYYGFAEFRRGAALAPVSGIAYSFFDETYYRAHNPDINAAILSGAIASGWVHFVAYGQYEGRAPSELYNEHTYLTRYPDIAAAVLSHALPDGFFHFYNYGFTEGRLGV